MLYIILMNRGTKTRDTAMVHKTWIWVDRASSPCKWWRWRYVSKFSSMVLFRIYIP